MYIDNSTKAFVLGLLLQRSCSFAFDMFIQHIQHEINLISFFLNMYIVLNEGKLEI